MAYCTKDDLLTGDIPLAGKYGDGTSFVNLAADEIDSQIGHLYVTPVELVPTEPSNRPALLLLKKINTLLASGRIILDMAAGGEDRDLNAYGRSMLNEALGLLMQITSGDIRLGGAELIPDTADVPNDRVSILNEDPYSLVQGFYTRYARDGRYGPPYLADAPMKPYDDNVVPNV